MQFKTLPKQELPSKEFEEYFKGNSDSYGQHIYKFNGDGKEHGDNFTVDGTPTIRNVEDHLDGKTGLGITLIDRDGNCWSAVIDVDIYSKVETSNIVEAIERNNLPLVPFRSKSGGLHLYLFFREPVSARRARARIAQLASVIGIDAKEIFPKQDVLKDGEKGNWINLPYYNVIDTKQYLIHNGKALPLSEALTYIKSKRTTFTELEESIDNLPFYDDPSLQKEYLTADTGENTGRNKLLFKTGIYYKAKYPDDWEERIFKLNETFKAPLSRSELESTVISSLRRKDYEYKARKEKKSPFKLRRISDIPSLPPKYRIAGFMEIMTHSLFVGEYGHGKTYVMISLACCIAMGLPFCGHKVKQGYVIFILGEGQQGIQRRILAWAIKNSIDINAIPIFISEQPGCLTDHNNVNSIIEAIKEIASEKGNPALIVIDTLARNIGGDENSTFDMSEYIQGTDKIRNEFNCDIISVHHPGHTNKDRARGSYALLGAVDQIFHIEKDADNIIHVTCKKMKDGETPEPFCLSFAKVQLGIKDEDGNEVESSVLVEHDNVPTAERREKNRLGKYEKQVLSIISVNAKDDEGIKKIEMPELQGKCDSLSARQLKNAIKSLVEKAYITIEGNTVAIGGAF